MSFIRFPGDILPYLLLFHQLRVGAIVNNMATKDRGCQWRIDLFGTNVAQFTIQDEFIALGAQVDRGFLSKKDESKNITVLSKVEEVSLMILSSQRGFSFP